MTNPTHAPADMLDARALAAAQDAYAHGILKNLQGDGYMVDPLECVKDAIRAYIASLPAGNEPVAAGATCEDCGGPTFSWTAPDELWNAVQGGPIAADDPGGMLCPNCFIRKAEASGIAPPAWTLYASLPAGNAEPVAWLWRMKIGGQWCGWATSDMDPNDWTWRDDWQDLQVRPLYASPFTPAEGETDALADVAAERERQKVVEGWGTAHDDAHENGEMALAAIAYAAVPGIEIKAHGWVPCGCRSVGECNHWGGRVQAWVDPWPWDAKWWKPTDRRRDLVKAGALILAEIERLDRAASRPTPSGPDLTKTERFLLDWLAKEDVSALRECYGPDLDRLVALGFAQIEGQRVSLTEAGVNAAKPTPGGEKGNG